MSDLYPASAGHAMDAAENAEFLSENVTAQAVDFIMNTGFSDIPSAVLDMSRRCIVDTTGLYVGGLRERATQIIVEMAMSDGGRSDSFLLGAGEVCVPAQIAARALGISAHAHDFDDTQVSNDPAHVYGLLTHPSAAPLSSTLALSHKLGDVAGERFMAAFCIGFEVSCKISEWMKPDHYLRGHHSSGTVATFGSAASAAWLLGLDRKATQNAFGIAAAMAAGIRCNFGTMSKPWHVGRASENGVMAALMAQRGFTGDPNALDGKWGFASVLAGGFSQEKLGQGFGSDWSVVNPGVSIKPYPSGILTHQAMDMMRDLVIDHDVKPENVERIEFFAGDNILNPIRYPIAANHLQAKFSMAALFAMIVLYRRAGISEFSDALICTPQFQDMQRRIKTAVDPQINAMGFDLIRSRVVVVLKDRTEIRAEADNRYRGGPMNPMSETDIEEKFRACCDGLDRGLQDRILVAANHLTKVDGPTELVHALRAIPALG
ncbi:MAG: MmgE/PrpD family protein [Rhizobiaceae bacterium]|nr:MmgE/PrpD family protein [Rhizobiaceae bacterium]